MTQATQRDEEPHDIGAAQQGDQQAFARLYQSHSGWIFGLCWRLAGGDRGLAEDWSQEAFIRAWNKLDQFQGDGSFAGWLRRITVNLALSDKRLKRSRVHLESLDASYEEGGYSHELAAPSPPWQGADQDLERAIAQLPERARIVLVLHSIEGYSHEEIAEATQMAVGSSKAQLHRARKLLQDWLNNE
ncbi:MAG: RNA polymerase sigma factor [Xanthomonadales bacterium]|jgi:RNA polymerase sigma-70 factor (ECF subfamily)|nr:RNA polymerase sigma factor [Xanthomonadales bacterium]